MTHKPIITEKGTELPLIDLKGKPYLQVAHRLVWFREKYPNWSVETDVKNAEGACLATAWIKDETGRIVAMGHKVEHKAHFGDFVEKAETGAIGRALALCGFGTQFAPELDEENRIVDSPVTRPIAHAAPAPARELAGTATDKQINMIRALQAGKQLPVAPTAELQRLTKQQASDLITELKQSETETPPAPVPDDIDLNEIDFS